MLEPETARALSTHWLEDASRMPRWGGLLRSTWLKVCLGRLLGTWICDQALVSKSLFQRVLLAVYPIQSFQSLIILKHLEATSRLYIQWHLYPGYSWSAACLLPGAFKKSGKGFRHCVVSLRQEGSSLSFKFLVYKTLFPFPFSLLHAHTHMA